MKERFINLDGFVKAADSIEICSTEQTEKSRDGK
jgi:hypothetical protein